MSQELSLHQRRRAPRPEELDGIPWLALLQPAERERAHKALVVGDAQSGDYVCRTGRAPTYWFGVVEGLLKMNTDGADGASMTLAGLPPGGWFGEGTAVKREPYRYNVQAIRKSVVAGLPIDTFHWLLDHSIGFNRFVMSQLNERLGQFISAREIDRLTNPDLHGTTAHQQLGLARCSHRRMGLEAPLRQAYRRLPDGLIDPLQRLVARRPVVGKHQVQINGQTRHIAHEQVDRGSALQRERVIHKHQRRDLCQQARGIEIGLVHGLSTNRPSADRDTQGLSLPVGSEAVSSLATQGSAPSRPS